MCCVMFMLSFIFLGGLGLGAMSACIVTEEIGYACTGISTAIDAARLGVSLRFPQVQYELR